MEKYYQEPNGDYLVVFDNRFHKTAGPEGRATAIAGEKSSVAVTAIAGSFLAKCKQVKKADVPEDWLYQLTL